MVGRVFLVLTGACQFGHGVGGFATNFMLDDDELLVRASAVLKSQGAENWSRGRPGDAIVTRILVSDRNIFSKKNMWRYLLDQAHMMMKGICC